MKLPDFYVEAQSYGVSVGWSDKTHRYHFWLTEDGKIKSDELHSNLLDENRNARSGGHQALRMKAKKWAPIIEGIMAKVAAGNMVADAWADAAAKQDAAEAERIRKINEDNLERFEKAVRRIPDMFLVGKLRELSDKTKLAFVAEFN